MFLQTIPPPAILIRPSSGGRGALYCLGETYAKFQHFFARYLQIKTLSFLSQKQFKKYIKIHLTEKKWFATRIYVLCFSPSDRLSGKLQKYFHQTSTMRAYPWPARCNKGTSLSDDIRLEHLRVMCAA